MLIAGVMRERKERRVSPRRKACAVTEIEIDGAVVHCSVSLDASVKGLLLLTRIVIAPGSRIKLRLYVPGRDDRRTLSGLVVRCERIPAKERELWSHRIAVSILDPPEDFESLVEMLSAKAQAE
jgi:hypothetical protein